MLTLQVNARLPLAFDAFAQSPSDFTAATVSEVGSGLPARAFRPPLFAASSARRTAPSMSDAPGASCSHPHAVSAAHASAASSILLRFILILPQHCPCRLLHCAPEPCRRHPVVSLRVMPDIASARCSCCLVRDASLRAR